MRQGWASYGQGIITILREKEGVGGGGGSGNKRRCECSGIAMIYALAL